jgi:hypothetical protein
VSGSKAKQMAERTKTMRPRMAATPVTKLRLAWRQKSRVARDVAGCRGLCDSYCKSRKRYTFLVYHFWHMPATFPSEIKAWYLTINHTVFPLFPLTEPPMSGKK